MKPLPALRRRLHSLVHGESGMALPVALMATIASVALAGAAVISSVDVQHGTKRDNGSKSAIAAADAGASVARLRLNSYATSLTAETPCLNVGLGGTLEAGAAAVDGWCAPIEGTVGSSTYSYRVSPVGGSCETYELCIVSTGYADNVSRRIELGFSEEGPGSEGSGEEPGGGEPGGGGEGEGGSEEQTGNGIEGLIGVDDVEIDNNADARVSVGTNGNIHVHNNGNVCGNIRHGIGKEAKFDNNGTQCDGYTVSEGNTTVTPVSSFIPSDIATNNSNYRLVQCTGTNVPAGCQTDTYSKKWSSTVPWNASTRTIETSNNTTLTLGGGDYFVCRLLLSNNSHLIMADGAQVRVFFDTPENCGLSSGAKQIDVSNNANITSTGYQPTLGKFDVPGFYLLGSDAIETKVEWSNNSGTNEFVLYAPKSNIELRNNAVFYGVIVGKTVHLQNNAIVLQDAGFVPPSEIIPGGESSEEEETESEGGEGGEGEPTASNLRWFTPQGYVECSGSAGATPNSDC